MAYRYRVTSERGKDGRWKLVVFEPTRHGHHRSQEIEGGSWETKKEADVARRTRVTWVRLKYTNGVTTPRHYSLRPEENE